MEIFTQLEKAFSLIEKAFSKESIEEFTQSNYKNLCDYHFSLGLWMRNHILQPNTPLYEIFYQTGIVHKDDMSSIMISLFYIYKHSK